MSSLFTLAGSPLSGLARSRWPASFMPSESPPLAAWTTSWLLVALSELMTVRGAGELVSEDVRKLLAVYSAEEGAELTRLCRPAAWVERAVIVGDEPIGREPVYLVLAMYRDHREAAWSSLDGLGFDVRDALLRDSDAEAVGCGIEFLEPLIAMLDLAKRALLLHSVAMAHLTLYERTGEPARLVAVVATAGEAVRCARVASADLAAASFGFSSALQAMGEAVGDHDVFDQAVLAALAAGDALAARDAVVAREGLVCTASVGWHGIR